MHSLAAKFLNITHMKYLGFHESPSKEYGNHFEERNGKRYIKLKIDPPYFKPLEPKLNDLGLPDKEFYTTKEVCGVLDLHPDTFRYRLRKGIYPEPKNRAGDKRRFIYEEVKEIIEIMGEFSQKKRKFRR